MSYQTCLLSLHVTCLACAAAAAVATGRVSPAAVPPRPLDVQVYTLPQRNEPPVHLRVLTSRAPWSFQSVVTPPPWKLSLQMKLAETAGSEDLTQRLAGRRLTEFLQRVNTGRTDDLKAWIQANFAPSALTETSAEQRAAFWALNHQYTHGLEVRRIVQASEYEMTALLQARLTEQWFQIRFALETEPPHRIVRDQTLPVALPDGVVVPGARRLTDKERVAELRAYLDRLVRADVFSGAVLVAKDGVPIFQHAYGWADKKRRMRNNLDTKFNLGSMNKMFTAITVAQLAEHGKLAFDDLVGKHLPDFPNRAVAEKVTIHHLLTHTSGLGNTFTAPPKTPLAFEPGSRFQYSSDGFLVLGLIIEKVSGQEYSDTIREHIYVPAGMTDTGIARPDGEVPNRAIGYTNVDWEKQRIELGERRESSFRGGLKGSPAGGGSSTVRDLLKFAVALQMHRLLTAPSTQRVLTPHVPTPFGENKFYGYGFIVERINGTRIVGHGGDAPGISAQLDIYPDRGYTVVVLSNFDQSIASAVATKIRMLLM